MARLVQLSELTHFGGGIHHEKDGHILTWGITADGQRAVAAERKPTEYELTQVPSWVREAILNG